MGRATNRLSMRCLLLGAMSLLGVAGLHAQSIQFGTLTGTVQSPDGAVLPDAQVVVQSDALVSGARTTATSRKGHFIFPSLPPGRYQLTVTAPGFKTHSQSGLSVSVASTTTVDVRMEIGAHEETVIVVAQSALIDARDSTIDTKFDAELLQKLPTGRNAFTDLALTAPGLSDVGADMAWLPSPSAYGGATNENLFLINGVNATNPRGSSWGSLVNVNYNTVEEVRVVALGTKAEYGSFSGVAVDVTTKSGSNTYHGDLGLYSQIGDAANNAPAGGDFGEDWLSAEPGDDLVTKPDKDYELNATFGGPLIKDKVWFYAGYAHSLRDTDTPIFVPLKQYRGDLFDLKVTAEPTSRHRAWIAYHFEKNRYGNESWGDTWDDTMVYDQNRNNHTLSAQWQFFWSGHTLLSAKYLGFQTDDEPTISGDVKNGGYVNWWKWDSYGVGGAFPYVEAQKSERHTVQADVSHHADDFLGQHELKFGVQYTLGEGNWMGGYFQGYANFAYPLRYSRSVEYQQGQYGDTGFQIYVRQQHLNPFLTVRQSDSYGGFLDDQWTIGNRLTLNVGLRYDRMTANYGEGALYQMPTTPAEINDPPPQIGTRRGTGNVFDFKTFSPRLGLAYQLTSDRKTLLRLNYGRYYAPISVENLRRFGPDMPAMRNVQLYYSVPFDVADADGDGEISNSELRESVRQLPSLTPYRSEELGAVDTSWELKVAGGTKSPYTDQLTAGVARELFKDLSLEATYIYKRSGDFLVDWPINRVTQQEWRYDKVPYTTSKGQQVEVYSIALEDYDGNGTTNFDDVLWVLRHTDHEVRNLPTVDGKKPQRTYQGLQLVFDKRYAHGWRLTGSFLYSKSNGVAPRTTSQDWFIDGPMIMDTSFVSSLNQLVNNMDGPMPMMPKYEVKLAGHVTVPRVKVDLGLRYRFHSGRPVWPLDVVPSYQSWDSGFQEGFIISTGGETAGNIVASDPDEPDYLPSQHIFDVGLGRDFQLGKAGRVGVNLDVLNLLNEDTVNKSGFRPGDYGRVYSLVSPRVARLSLKYSF